MKHIFPSQIDKEIVDSMKLALRVKSRRAYSWEKNREYKAVLEKLDRGYMLYEEDLNDLWAFIDSRDYSDDHKKWPKDFMKVRDLFDLKIFKELGT